MGNGFSRHESYMEVVADIYHCFKWRKWTRKIESFMETDSKDRIYVAYLRRISWLDYPLLSGLL